MNANSNSQVPDALADYPVRVRRPIVWGDMDAYGHLNNIKYFRLFEDVRIEYLRLLGVATSGPPKGLGVILGRTSCVFRAALQFPDEVIVGARVPEIAADRFTMEYVIFSMTQEVVAARGDGVLVAYDYSAKSKAPLPAEWSVKLEAIALGSGE